MVYSVTFRVSHFLLPVVIAFALMSCLAICVPAVRAQTPYVPPGAEDRRPLSAAQVALFETAHLGNVTRPTTLRYTYCRVGPEGFTDAVAVDVRSINADGTKDVNVDYLTGPRQVVFPPFDHFRG